MVSWSCITNIKSVSRVNKDIVIRCVGNNHLSCQSVLIPSGTFIREMCETLYYMDNHLCNKIGMSAAFDSK